MREKRFNALPGFGLTMGYTMLYLCLIVLIPLGALFLRVFNTGINSPDFSLSDVEEDAEAVVEKLRTHEEPVTAFLWQRFPEPLRQQLTASAGAETIGSALQTNVVRELNTILRGGSIYDERRFEAVTLSEKTQWLLRKRGWFTGWLNRSLIQDAFAGLIKKKTNWLDLWLMSISQRAMSAYKLTFGASFVAAIINAVFGTLLAWVLVRYQFPGKRFFDALVDFPFALPTAVAGLTLASLFSESGWLGQFLVPLGIRGAFTSLGVIIALTFIGMPFVVRTLQPVLENFEREVEEAAATLGAGRLRTFVKIVAPTLAPAILTGFALAFARAIGEFGSVIFIAGNKPNESEIAPLLIIIRLEEYDYTGAMALAVVLLVVSFALLITINLLERWASRFQN
jgi:sulfate transport system permease protein